MASEEETEVVRKKRAHYELAKRTLILLAAAWMTAMMSVVAYSTWVGHDQRDILLDCTTPGGECYEKNQERSAEVVQALLEDGLRREEVTRAIIRAAAYCADQPGTQTLLQIERCVERELQ